MKAGKLRLPCEFQEEGCQHKDSEGSVPVGSAGGESVGKSPPAVLAQRTDVGDSWGPPGSSGSLSVRVSAATAPKAQGLLLSPPKSHPGVCPANSRTHVGTEKLSQGRAALLSSCRRRPRWGGGVPAPHEITSFHPPNNSLT